MTTSDSPSIKNFAIDLEVGLSASSAATTADLSA